MKFKLFILNGLVISLGTLASCTKDTQNPTETPLPPVTCYNVKESKTYVFTNNVVTDSAIFRLTFDNQNRILSQWSLNDDLLLELNYSDSTVIQMNQRVKSTNKLSFFTHYILNKQGFATVKKVYASDSALSVITKMHYDKLGHRIKEYFFSGMDSTLIFNGTWQNECITQFYFPNYETQVVSTFTKYPDNRNLGFSKFLRDKSYYLVDTEVYTTRGAVRTYQYKYQFDSLNRPVVVTMYLDQVKVQEKYYTYY